MNISHPTPAFIEGVFMLKKFQNRYRTQTIRLRGWDYSRGIYFITICTKNRIPWFGKIVNGEMRLNDMGNIVAQEWIKTEKIRNEIRLDEWIVMPDHFHAIVALFPQSGEPGSLAGETRVLASLRPPRPDHASRSNKYGNQSRNLAACVGAFKSSCTRRIRRIGHPNFKWQSRYWDTIIRNEKHLYNVQRYIRNNPSAWGKKNNPRST